MTERLAQVSERFLHDEWSDRPRTVAEQLGHLAEFPRQVARQLDEWRSGQRVVVGRTTPDVDLENALAVATRSRLVPLVDGVGLSAAELDSALAALTDEHLRATVQHVVHGREPLVTFLIRSVLRHKARHSEELASTLAALPAERDAPPRCAGSSGAAGRTPPVGVPEGSGG